jgi:hypothetical protein
LQNGVVLASCCGEIFCLDPLTGHLRWHNPLKGFGTGLATFATDTAGVSRNVVRRSYVAGPSTVNWKHSAASAGNADSDTITSPAAQLLPGKRLAMQPSALRLDSGSANRQMTVHGT